MSVDADISKSLAEANRHWTAFMATVQIYQSNCQRGDFAAAEAERERAHAAIDSHFDAFAAAGKRVAQSQ